MAKKKPVNPWMTHLGKVRKMKEHKGKSLGDCMKIAKASYTPVKKKK